MIPHDNKQFLAFADRILKAIDDLHKTNASIAEYAKAAKDAAERKPASPLRTEVEFSPGIIQTYGSYKDSGYRLQKRSFWVGLITLFVLGLYTIFTYLLWRSSQAGMEAANKSFSQTLCQMQAQTKAQQDAAIASGKAANAMADQVKRLQAGVNETHLLAVQAQKSAEVGQASLDAGIRAAQLDQRPWVGIVGVNTRGGKYVDETLPEGKVVGISFNSVSIVIHNSGKTPAIRMSVFCCIVDTLEPSEPIPSEDISTHDIEKQFLHGGDVLPPQVIREVEVVPGPSRLGTRRHDYVTVYLRGRITYFGNPASNPQHITQFCLMSRNDSFVICPEGNRME